MALLDSILWDGKSIRDFGAEVTEIRGRGKPQIKRRSMNISGRHGALTFGAKYLPRRIEFDGYVEGASHTTLLGDIDNIKDLFSLRGSIEALGNEELSDTNLIGKLEFGDQTDRHYRAQYDGIFGLRDISPRWMKNDLIRFGVRFLCTDPFAYANTITEATITPTADAFKVFDTGTHLSECDIDIHGAVTNPVIVTGDKVGVAHFDNNDDLRNVENVNVAGNFTAAFGFRTRKTLTSQQSKAIQIVNKDNLYYDRGTQINGFNYTNFNPHQGTFIFWVKPYFDAEDGKSHFIFISFASASDRFELQKTSGDDLRLTTRLGGGASLLRTIAVNSSNFGAGSWHQIVVRWDINNTIDGTNYVSLGLDETFNESSAQPIAPTANDQFFAIGQDYDTTPDGSSRIFDGLIYGEIHERALTDTEVTALYNSGAGVEPFVTPDTKLLSAGELSSGDPVSVQYPWVDNEFTDGDQEVDPSAEWSASSVDVIITNEATIVKYDLQSAQLDWDAAVSGDYANLDTGALVNDQDYFYRLWVYAGVLDGSDELHLDIVGNSTVLTRRLDTGIDDMGVSYVTGKWLYYEGTFEADGAVAHEFRIRKNNANGNATIYVDQMDCQPMSQINNAGFEGTYTAGLVPSWALNGAPTVAEENAIIHTGLASQKITSNSTNEGVFQSGALTADRWYIFSVWARGAVGGETLRLLLSQFSDIAGNSDATFILTTSFAKYSIMFKTGLDTSGRRNINLSLSGETMYIDDAPLIQLDTVVANAASAATPEAISYSPAKYKQGLRIDGGDTLSWALVGNPNEGSIIVWLEPQFDADWADDTIDPLILQLFESTTDYVSIFYDWTDDKWQFRKRVANLNYEGLFSSTHSKGDRLNIIGTWGANGVRIYVNSVLGGTVDANTDALGGIPTKLNMHFEGSTELVPDSIIDEVYVLSRELSAQEALAYFNNPKASKLDNRVFGITRAYAANDKAIIRTLPETLEFADESGDTIVNDISSMNSGSQFPRLPANKAVVYNKVAAVSIDLNYRKRFL